MRLMLLLYGTYGRVFTETIPDVPQETIQRCSALLQMGANDEASPAHAQLERHMQLLVKVRFYTGTHVQGVVEL